VTGVTERGPLIPYPYSVWAQYVTCVTERSKSIPCGLLWWQDSNVSALLVVTRVQSSQELERQESQESHPPSVTLTKRPHYLTSCL